jgi:GAF domain-containing protein
VPDGAPPRAGAALTARQLARFAVAAADAGPLPRLQAAAEIVRQATGPGLCTAMRFDAAAMTVRRLYSSDPASYPVGGAKPKRDTPWGRIVLLDRQVFVGEDEAAIRQYFDDHALILGLGLRSVVNVPVLLRGGCVGTLNLLWPEPRVAPDRRALAQLLGLLVAPDWVE